MQLDTRTIWPQLQSILVWAPDWLIGTAILLAADDIKVVIELA
jgi:hypothetical protein